MSELLCKQSEQFLEAAGSFSLWFSSSELLLLSEQLLKLKGSSSWCFSSSVLWFPSVVRGVIWMGLAIFLLGRTAWLSVEHKAANTPSFDLGFLANRAFFAGSGSFSLEANFRFNLRDSNAPSSPSGFSGCFFGGGLYSSSSSSSA